MESEGSGSDTGSTSHPDPLREMETLVTVLHRRARAAEERARRAEAAVVQEKLENQRLQAVIRDMAQRDSVIAEHVEGSLSSAEYYLKKLSWDVKSALQAIQPISEKESSDGQE